MTSDAQTHNHLKKKKFSYKQYAKALFFKKKYYTLRYLTFHTFFFFHYCLELLAAGTFFLSCFFFLFLATIPYLKVLGITDMFYISILSGEENIYFKIEGKNIQQNVRGDRSPKAWPATNPPCQAPDRLVWVALFPPGEGAETGADRRLKQDRKVKWDTE